MKSVPRKVFDVLEVYLPAVIFCVLILSVFIQVAARYLFNLPIPQLFETSLYSFIWVIYLGGALATRFNQHMRFDLRYRKLPPIARTISDSFFDLLLNVVVVVIFQPTVAAIIQMYPLRAATLNISWSYLLVCFPVFLILIFIHNCAAIYYRIREKATGKPVPEETPPWL